MGGVVSCLARCLAWGAQHWNLLVVEWSWALALRQRSLGEFPLINITWGWAVSGDPVSWIRLSHLRSWGLTPSWSTNTLSVTRLWMWRSPLWSWIMRVLDVYIEVFTGFSNGFGTDGVKNTLLSQGCVVETAPRSEGLQAAGRRDCPVLTASCDSCHEPCCCCCQIRLPLPLCLKQGPGATPHCVQQTAGRTWRQASLKYFHKNKTLYNSVNVM